MGIGLVLQFVETGVAKTCEGILNVGQHGQVYFTVGLVPVDIHVKITSTVPVLLNSVMFFEDGDEVSYVLFSNVLKPKIINI